MVTYLMPGDGNNPSVWFLTAAGEAYSGDVVSAPTADTDLLYGFGGADILSGLTLNDVIQGHDGADTLDGGSGSDLLLGGADDDTITGGAGDDVVYGGTGIDTAVVGRAFANQDIAYRGLSVVIRDRTTLETDVFYQIEKFAFTDFPTVVDRSLGDGVDDLFYLDVYSDLEASFRIGGFDPTAHYYTYGGFSPEKRSPNPLFDHNFYEAQVGTITGQTALSHYLANGHSSLANPHPFFDTSEYLSANPDVTTVMNALQHYLGWGIDEGRRRAPGFDDVFYLSSNPDIEAALWDPYGHFLIWGQSESRMGVPPNGSTIGQTGRSGAQNFVGSSGRGENFSTTVDYSTAPATLLFDQNGNPVLRHDSSTGLNYQVPIGVGVFMSHPPGADPRTNPAGNFGFGDTFTGITTVRGSAYDDYMRGFGGSVTFFGGAGNDTFESMVISGQNAWLYGEAGDDLFLAQVGPEHFDGGAHRPAWGDHLSYFLGEGVRAHLSLGSGAGVRPTQYVSHHGGLQANEGGRAAGDTFVGIEVLLGSGNQWSNGALVSKSTINDYLEGDDQPFNQLLGQDGDDILQAGVKSTGGTNFIGGAGADQFWGAWTYSGSTRVSHQPTGVTYFISFETVSDLINVDGSTPVGYEYVKKGVKVDLLYQATTFDTEPDTPANYNAARGDRFHHLTSADGVWNLGLAGSPFSDIIYADHGDNQILGDPTAIGYGVAGADEIHGRGGNDVIHGDDFTENPLNLGGADSLYGDDGNDHLDGMIGGDVLDGGAGNDRLIGGAGGDVLTGGSGADRFLIDKVAESAAGASDYILDFETGVDKISLGYDYPTFIANSFSQITIQRTAGGTFVYATKVGADAGTIVIATQNDDVNAADLEGVTIGVTLDGSTGPDTLIGGAFNDVIQGGDGADGLTGGAGADRFVYAAASHASAADSIFDFVSGTDKLDLRPLGITAARVGVISQDGATFVFIDSDGVGGGDMTIQLTNTPTFSITGDILFS